MSEDERRRHRTEIGSAREAREVADMRLLGRTL